MHRDTICRRVGGRRKYHRVRQFRAKQRLLRVGELFREIGFSHGYETRIVESLGVSHATICRDIARLFHRYVGGKEAEERHGNQQHINRGIQVEEKLELDRMASEQAASQGHTAPPASPQPDVPPPTMDPAQAIFAPR